jgi:lipid II:glycine glycyltransferase (peptidoglycan interpeptide bridge formation enzyme)
MPIFASESFLKTVGDEYGWIGGVEDSGKLRCVLPYTVIRKFGVRIVRFRVETIALGGELALEEEKSFLNSTVEYFRSSKADMIIPASNTALFRTYPDGALVAPYGTFIKDLSQSEESLFSEISPDYRKNIRRAVKGGVQVKYGIGYLNDAYNLIAEILKSSSVKRDFTSQIVGLGEYVRIFVAEHDGVLQACMIAPFSECSAYSWYSGTISQPCKGAMHLLQWESIRHFKQMGVKRFNFNGVRINPEKGSRQEGIRNFKMRFGGKLERGYMWKFSLHPLKFALYCIAARILLGGDIVDLERSKLGSEQSSN